MRRGEFHQFGDRLRLDRILGIFENRIDVGLRGRENLELVIAKALGGFRRAFLHTPGGFAGGLAGSRHSFANGVGGTFLSGFALVHGGSLLAMTVASCRAGLAAGRRRYGENAAGAVWFYSRPGAIGNAVDSRARAVRRSPAFSLCGVICTAARQKKARWRSQPKRGPTTPAPLRSNAKTGLGHR